MNPPKIFSIIYSIRDNNLARATIYASQLQWCKPRLIIPEAILHLMNWARKHPVEKQE